MPHSPARKAAGVPCNFTGWPDHGHDGAVGPAAGRRAPGRRRARPPCRVRRQLPRSLRPRPDRSAVLVEADEADKSKKSREAIAAHDVARVQPNTPANAEAAFNAYQRYLATKQEHRDAARKTYNAYVEMEKALGEGKGARGSRAPDERDQEGGRRS